MSFINEYPTNKTAQEEELELKMKLESLIRTALRKTSQERTEGLILTDEQIEKIVSRVRRLSFDNSKRGASSLEGIINRALHGSNDPEIESILSQQSKIYRAKQAEFRKSEEYEVAQEINKTHPDVIEKIMLAFDIAVCEEKEDGTVEMYCSCDESRLISSKHDNAVIKTKDGKTTIKVLEPDNSEKTLPDK